MRRTNYFEDLAFDGLFTPHPDYPLPVRPQAPALPEPEPAPPPKLDYGPIVMQSLVRAVLLAGATILLTAGYCWGLARYGAWLYQQSVPLNRVFNICFFFLFLTLAALWFFFLTNRSRPRLIAACVAVPVCNGLCWAGSGMHPWNEALTMAVVYPILFAATLFSAEASSHVGAWMLVAIACAAVWFVVLLRRRLRQVRAGEGSEA